MDLLSQTWFGNALSTWLVALALTVAALILLRGLRNLTVRRLQHVAQCVAEPGLRKEVHNCLGALSDCGAGRLL